MDGWELKEALEFSKSSESRLAWTQDLFWTVINMREFIFVR